MRRDEVTALLERARRRITDPARWTQGVQARAVDGFCVDPLDNEAAAWCAVGAIRREAGRSIMATWELRGAAYGRLDVVAGRAIEDVNDTAGHAAVLAVFDAAIRGK